MSVHQRRALIRPSAEKTVQGVIAFLKDGLWDMVQLSEDGGFTASFRVLRVPVL